MNTSYNKGYSIVEILIYLSIFTIMSIVVINSFIVTATSFSATRTNRDLLESGSLAMERIAREVRQAQSVDIINSTLNSTPGVLQLNSTDSSGTAMTVKFSVSGNSLNLYQNNVIVGNLLGANISVTNLVFRRIVTTESEAVKVEMILQDTRSKTPRTESFYDTIILRGAY